MVINNPYIEKVLQDTDIFKDTEVIYKNKWNWNTYFWNNNPLVLEIGTGMGNFFWKLCEENPNKNFLWMEIRYKRLFSSAQKARNWKNDNFVILKDFAQNIDSIFSASEISETYIFFPDPWANKDRQRKHRLLQESFLQKLHEITSIWWKVFFKTDHQEYFLSTLEIIKKQGIWKTKQISHDYENETEIFDTQKLTEFEAHYRGSKLKIHYLELEK